MAVEEHRRLAWGMQVFAIDIRKALAILAIDLDGADILQPGRFHLLLDQLGALLNVGHIGCAATDAGDRDELSQIVGVALLVFGEVVESVFHSGKAMLGEGTMKQASMVTSA